MTEYRIESVMFVIALILAIGAASVTTIISTSDVNDDALVGMKAFGQPRQQTDLVLGNALERTAQTNPR
jgi:hypothetical protein